MSVDFIMPALSPTMEKGTLARWLVSVGDQVRRGDVVAEIESDKATMEFEATHEGQIAELLVAAGTDDVPVGAVIARLGSPRTEIAEPAPAAMEDEILRDPAPSPPTDRADPIATPLVQRLARATGIDLSGRKGSGSGGRIVLADLGLTQDLPTPSAEAVIADRHAAPETLAGQTIALSSMRRTIARRLTEAKRDVPHFYLAMRCNLDPLLALRSELNASLATRGIKISVNDMLMKALALALAAVPEANVQFGGDVLHRFNKIDLSMAVSVEGGLVTPVLRDVANRSLAGIAGEARSLAARARDGELTPADYQGGTASISNLGMFGVEEMIPVINPPQALIVGVGAGLVRPWGVDGQLALATVAVLTASFDHRAIDGVGAARFMSALRQHVETPALILC